MNKKVGFSLAEALITLLIVCIVAIVSAPLITKKARKTTPESIWTLNKDSLSSISPSANRDIKLGNTSGKNYQGIVVAGRLEFKNTDGETIGWIDEDGSNSFASTPVSNDKQDQIIQLLTSLSQELTKAIAEDKNKSSIAPKSTVGSKRNIDYSINNEQMQNIEVLQQELNKLLEMNNR